MNKEAIEKTRDIAGILSYQCIDGMLNPCEDLASKRWSKAQVPEVKE